MTLILNQIDNECLLSSVPFVENYKACTDRILCFRRLKQLSRGEGGKPLRWEGQKIISSLARGHPVVTGRESQKIRL